MRARRNSVMIGGGSPARFPLPPLRLLALLPLLLPASFPAVGLTAEPVQAPRPSLSGDPPASLREAGGRAWSPADEEGAGASPSGRVPASPREEREGGEYPAGRSGAEGRTTAGGSTAGASGEPAAPQGSPAAVVVDRIAAVVNNEVITLSEVDSQLPGPTVSQEERARLRRETLDRLIEATLVSQEAARANITVTDQEVDAEMAAVREREKLSEEEFIRALAQEGLTLTEYRSRLRDNIRRAKVVSRMVRGSLTIPDARLREYYEQHKDRFTPPATLRLRLLLLPLDRDATDAERAVVRAEAQALRLQAVSGEPFEALVKAHSKGPAAEEGGDLGTVRAGQLDPRFEAAVKGLKPGQVSPPVVLESGVALLQLVERSGGEPEPFEKVRDQIYRILYEEEFERALDGWIKELKTKAAIEVKL